MFTFTFFIGLMSQLCYGARQLVQWVMTERLKRVVSPTGYWAFSLAGCCFMLWYGWLREDIVILLGQILSFYVYVLNLDYKGAWRRVPLPVRVILYFVPVVALIATAVNAPHLVDRFIHNPHIPLGLMIYAATGVLAHQRGGSIAHAHLRHRAPRPHSHARPEHFNPYLLAQPVGGMALL